MKLKEFFYLQKSDRQVILVLASVIVIAFTLLYIIGEQYGNTNPSGERAMTDSIPSYTSDFQQHNRDTAIDEQPTSVQLFPFDPNTADSTQLLRLGLQRWQVRNIYRYRQKGGVYRQPSDFARLYGLTVKQYKALAPYIRISPDYLPASTLFPEHRNNGERKEYSHSSGNNGELTNTNSPSSIKSPQLESSKPRYSPKLSPGETVILNTADTTALQRVPGIGSYYSKAILRYAQRLGGYCRVEQLLEINGFPEESLPYFTIQNPEVQQLNVNTLTLEQLRKHPYINFYQARAILDYRRLHGFLHSLEDLKLLKEFPPEALQRLKPYVCF